MRQLQITPSFTNRDSQSLETYLNELGRTDLLSAEEEVVLAQKIRLGDQAALDRLTKTNLRFVVSVAKKYQHQGLPLSDLISEGNVGLMKAAKKFDETKGFKFISYAVWWIRQCILSAIAEHSRMIRLPMNQVGDITKMNKALALLEQQMERQPTTNELAEYLETSEDKVSDALYFATRTASYDAPFRTEDENNLLDVLPGNEQATDHELMVLSNQQEVRQLLSTLTSRDQEVIRWTFGLDGKTALPPIDIAPLLGISAERVRQIRNQALQTLREQAATTTFQHHS
ncbi:sigma-70 family RNA polymerase sigma factor [Mucilaginibacter paludis]|uniref:RNA polymerase, sigma 70 subunit, RpoD subfamily n=1 Tax=Mucilaginibacter paludis DSM 18603 TaxID=714943 RepID=H1Y3F6_9SPHI|nr:sigma-70 family RNA polymerase sigma factor [Mucilaginibacter paludis]EHQ29724.1 RNA polymerase, sigma 70 subunit, RpoD subfamily [Mucilaginibacter paludis DSM 18603]